MILQSLYELYNRLSGDPEYRIPPPGYSLQKIFFKVVIKKDGTLHAVETLVDPTSKKPRLMIMPGGDKPTGKVTIQSVHRKVQFLRNDLPFLLGLSTDSGEGTTLSKSEMEFEAFRKYHLEKEEAIGDGDYAIFCTFLRQWRPEHAFNRTKEWRGIAEGQGVVQVLGKSEYLHDRPAVKAWWNSQTSSRNSKIAQCLITGATGPIARLHEPKIRGVRGAQTSGAPLISFDKDSDAFASYGYDGEQGFNSPVSEDATFRYATVLNALLNGPKNRKHRFFLADATVVFWTGEPSFTEDIFARFASTGSMIENNKEVQDEKLRQKMALFLEALRKGAEAYSEIETKADSTPFFILGLTGQAKGRLGVRFFYRDTISHMLDNLRLHYAHMQIQPWYVEGSKSPDPEFPALWQLLDETCPRRKGKVDRDKIPPVLAGPLLRSVISGSDYPVGLFFSVMRRIHSDGEINYIRVSIIKGYLMRNEKKEVSMALDRNRKEPAYLLGRLFAALEKTQGDAQGKIGATIRDRFYSSASATPAVVFPRLLRIYQHHLAKMEKGKVGREMLVREIHDSLVDYPAYLGLSDQGLFAIGYYHQMKAMWTSRQGNDEDKGGDQQ